MSLEFEIVLDTGLLIHEGRVHCNQGTVQNFRQGNCKIPNHCHLPNVN